MTSGSPNGRHRRPSTTKLHRRPAFLAALALIVLGVGTLLVPFASRRSDPGPDPANVPAAATAPSRESAGLDVGVDSVAAPLLPSPETTPTPSPRAQASTPKPRVSPSAPSVSRSPAAAPAAPRTARPSGSASRAPSTGGASAPANSTPDPADQVVTLVNRERAAAGCPAVTAHPQLTEAARRHSADQAAHNTMSHTGSDGSSPWERAERAGYSAAIGENVAAGYRTAEAVMTGWMESEGHRANILNCQARAIGVGIATAKNGTIYWTQMFGSAA